MAVDFGSDLDLAEDMAATGRRVSGNTLVGQAIFRRLTTPRGMLIDDRDYGFDVRSLLSRAQTATQLAAIPGLVRSEVLKDERVATCSVAITERTMFALTLFVAVETSEGPFDLTITVDKFRAKLADLNA